MRRRSALLFVALATQLVMAAACAAFSSSPDPGASDAGTQDEKGSALDGQAPDAQVDAAGDVNDIIHDDFELTTSCNPWVGNMAILTVIDGGAAGTASACHVCAQPNGYAHRSVTLPRGNFVLDGYARAGSGGWSIQLNVTLADGGVYYPQSSGSLAPFEQWNPVQVGNITLDALATADIIFARTTADAQCMDFDEMVIH